MSTTPPPNQPPTPQTKPPLTHRFWHLFPFREVQEAGKEHPVRGIIALLFIVGIPILAAIVYLPEIVEMFHARSLTPTHDAVHDVHTEVGTMHENVEEVGRRTEQIDQNLQQVDKRVADTRRELSGVNAQLSRLDQQRRDDLAMVTESIVIHGGSIDNVAVQMTDLKQQVAQLVMAIGGDPLATVKTADGHEPVPLSDDQPVLGLFYYQDNNTLRWLDDNAPPVRGGQFLKVVIATARADDGKTVVPYLLAIEGDGSAHLYDQHQLAAVEGDWRVGIDADCETLLVLAADHELSDDERTSLEARLGRPGDAPAIRPNLQYVWANGKVLPWQSRHATRSLERNANADLDWTSRINVALFETGFAYHGYTYPVDHDPEAQAAP